jgi:hypothetical protein
VVAAAVLVSAAVVAACSSSSDNSCGSGTPPSLAGAWDLLTYTVGVTTLPAPDQVTGLLQINGAATGTYSINITLAADPTHPIVDNGTYTLTGQHCMSQTSANGLPQFTGTFTLSNDTLTVQGTANGQHIANTWKLSPP